MSLKSILTDLANAIRNKSGITDGMTLEQMIQAVDSIQRGTDTSDATATATDIADGKTAYANGEKVVGTIPKVSKIVKEEPAVSVTTKFEVEKTEIGMSEPSDCNSNTKYSSYSITRDGYFKLSGSAVPGDAYCYLKNLTTNAKSIYYLKYRGYGTTGNVLYTYYLLSIVEKNNVTFRSEMVESDGKGIISPGTVLTQVVEPAQFGDAAAEDVVAGKTFTSSAGLKVTGTHECSGGLDTSDATAVAADILAGKTAYVNGQKVTGSIASRSAQTITPGTSDQTIASGQYLSGKQTIKGDANLLAENIKSGVTVFGVGGTYAGTGGLDTSDATATAEDIEKGKTAYVNGEKITGSLTRIDGLSGPAEPGFNESTEKIKLTYTNTEKRLFSANGTIVLSSDASNFGDATADDVAAGKTFTSDATAVAADILAGKTAYVNGNKVTGTIQSKGAADLTTSGASVSVPAGYYASDVSKSVSTVAQAVPTISVSSSGKITATAVQPAGYVESGDKSATKQLTIQTAQTITPGTADKTIASGKYLTGTQTIKGDANLLAENIKSGVSIFGIDGSFKASNSGKYAWTKYEVLNYEITRTSLGTTEPSDCGATMYLDYSITDDGYFKLSGKGILSGYHYITGQSSNAKSIYLETYSYGGNNSYTMITLSDERIDTTKGRKLGYVVSNSSSDYPEDGVQDGFWYVKITE